MKHLLILLLQNVGGFFNRIVVLLGRNFVVVDEEWQSVYTQMYIKMDDMRATQK